FTPTDYPYSGPTPPGCKTPFNSGRFARIYHPETNWEYFGVISTVTIGTSGEIDIQLATTPDIPVRATSSFGISGVRATGQAWPSRPAQRVRYTRGTPRGPSPARSQYVAQCGGPGIVTPYAPGGVDVTGDSGRTELVRVELDKDDQDLDATAELVAEYAVDM